MSIYNTTYFSSGIFSQDYTLMADVIAASYSPKAILDVGCGPAHLSRALAAKGMAVTAVDGHAQPDLNGTGITFHSCDLNSPPALTALAGKLKGPFDLAICLEVAEHLDPARSDDLIGFLCAQAPVVVFSAAIPGQGGNGHINCQPREAWHDRFEQRGFHLAHRLRPQLRDEPSVAPWYRYNLLDYVRDPLPAGVQGSLVRNLLASESSVTSAYYAQGDELKRLQALLSYAPVRAYLNLRRLAKRLLRR